MRIAKEEICQWNNETCDSLLVVYFLAPSILRGRFLYVLSSAMRMLPQALRQCVVVLSSVCGHHLGRRSHRTNSPDQLSVDTFMRSLLHRRTDNHTTGPLMTMGSWESLVRPIPNKAGWQLVCSPWAHRSDILGVPDTGPSSG